MQVLNKKHTRITVVLVVDVTRISSGIKELCIIAIERTAACSSTVLSAITSKDLAMSIVKKQSRKSLTQKLILSILIKT